MTCYRTESARGSIGCMQATLWSFADCPNWRGPGQRLRQELDEIGRTDAEVRLVPVESEAQTASVGFAGSPTRTVEGVDLFDAAASTGALTCRIDPTPDGLAGVPEVSDVVATPTEKVPS